MQQTHEFYSARVAEAKAEAKAATLANVRERALRSQATWQALADQSLRVRAQRDKLEREKEERAIKAAEEAAVPSEAAEEA